MKVQTSVRVEDTYFKESKKVFDAFGMSFGDAVNLFLAKVSMEKKIPFEISLPSNELEERVKNLEENANTKSYKDSKELFNDLGI